MITLTDLTLAITRGGPDRTHARRCAHTHTHMHTNTHTYRQASHVQANIIACGCMYVMNVQHRCDSEPIPRLSTQGREREGGFSIAFREQHQICGELPEGTRHEPFLASWSRLLSHLQGVSGNYGCSLLKKHLEQWREEQHLQSPKCSRFLT